MSVFGNWYRSGTSVIPSFRYQKDNIVKGLSIRLTDNFNLGQEQNVDTVYRHYNWFQQYKQYEGLGAERERSLYKFRNNNGLLTTNVNYQLGEKRSLNVNNAITPSEKLTIAIHSPSSWNRTAETNASGQAEFTPLWPGTYYIETSKSEKETGEQGGKAYQSVWRCATYVVNVTN